MIIDSYFCEQWKSIIELMASTNTVKDVGTLLGAIVVVLRSSSSAEEYHCPEMMC